jgi:hypothetical protein
VIAIGLAVLHRHVSTAGSPALDGENGACDNGLATETGPGRRGEQRKPPDQVASSVRRYQRTEENRVTSADHTPDELGIAERYLSVLNDMSRCAQAVRDGNWQDLADTADDLRRRAALLAEAAGKLHHAGTQPRTDVVVDIVTSRNPESLAARLLHPPGTIAKTAMTDPFTHPGTPPTGR